MLHWGTESSVVSPVTLRCAENLALLFSCKCLELFHRSHACWAERRESHLSARQSLVGLFFSFDIFIGV